MDSLLYRSRQAWFFQQGWTPLQSIIPALAGSIMLLTGVLPWVIEPLGGSYSAWDLPFNIGWPFLPTALFNYGLFCLGYGIYTLVIAYQNWQALKNNKPSSAQRPTLAGILCLSLPACFL